MNWIFSIVIAENAIQIVANILGYLFGYLFHWQLLALHAFSVQFYTQEPRWHSVYVNGARLMHRSAIDFQTFHCSSCRTECSGTRGSLPLDHLRHSTTALNDSTETTDVVSVVFTATPKCQFFMNEKCNERFIEETS